MRNMLLAAVVLVIAACGAYRFPGSTPSGVGTVSGTVIAIPCFPVAQPAAQAVPQCANPCFPVAQPGANALPQCTARPVGGVAITCFPVEKAAAQALPQCAGRPVAGLEIDFTGVDGTAKAVTDSMGHYTATLAVGTWSVHLVTSFHIISGPQQVTVVSGATVIATYIVDSGIRVPVPQQ